MNIWVKILPILLFFFFTPTLVEARSGCCSHHGGVCGCGCCDGTALSSTCAPYYPECNGGYDDSYDTTIFHSYEFPNMNATWDWTPNSNQTFNLKVVLDDPSPSQYSAVINKCQGCDPGPKTDFYLNTFNFDGLKTGRYYLNVKKEINGYWSNTVYWTIDIPKWYPPQPSSTPTTIISNYLNNESSTSSDMDSFLLGALLAGGSFGTIWWFSTKDSKKS